MWSTLLFGALASSALVIGAAIGVRFELPKRLLAILLSFAAGALITALSFELFEDSYERGGIWLAAAGLFAGSFVPRVMFDEARQVTIPLHVLLQWDDEGNDRQVALDLFDAFGSREKTLQANLGGHTGVPPFAGDDAARFFVRHLSDAPPAAPPAPGPLRPRPPAPAACRARRHG